MSDLNRRGGSRYAPSIADASVHNLHPAKSSGPRPAFANSNSPDFAGNASLAVHELHHRFPFTFSESLDRISTPRSRQPGGPVSVWG